MHGLITTWVYYGHTNASPEILNSYNNFVVPNMESVDPKNQRVAMALLHEEDDHNP